VKHRPGRKAGALIVLVDGAPVYYLERGGKTALVFTEDEDQLRAGARSLASTVTAGRIEKLGIEQVNGTFVLGTPTGHALREAGFVETPRGLRLRRG
jgi:ATP-dependent Lhr-like helicase